MTGVHHLVPTGADEARALPTAVIDEGAGHLAPAGPPLLLPAPAADR